jgi:hypothetical protein
MQNDRRLRRAIRGMTAACGVIAFLGAYMIAFAQETHCTRIADSNNTFGRSS